MPSRHVAPPDIGVIRSDIDLGVFSDFPRKIAEKTSIRGI